MKLSASFNRTTERTNEQQSRFLFKNLIWILLKPIFLLRSILSPLIMELIFLYKEKGAVGKSKNLLCGWIIFDLMCFQRIYFSYLRFTSPFRVLFCVFFESGHVALLGFVKSLNVPINKFNCLNIRNRIRIFAPSSSWRTIIYIKI